MNQLVGFTDGETTASYAYNASGLRYEKTVNGETINHVWDGSNQIIADVVESQFYEANCYIRGTNLVATYHYQNGAKSDYTYYVQNAHGDVVNLTDADGAVTKTYHYDAFGVELDPTTGDVNVFRYCGEYFDTETGTVYLRARYYQAAIGRFTQRDSYAGENEDPLSLNLYTYCGNNPIVNFDPSGHAWYHWAIGAAIVVGCAALTVATAGGFAAGMCAIGFAAAGASVGGAAGVFATATVASGMALAGSALWASANSETIQDFNEQGDWWTVAGVAGSAAFAGGMESLRQYAESKANSTTRTVEFNNKTVIQDDSLFDPYATDSNGRTNIERMQQRLAPVGYDNKPVNIHHIDQTNDGPVMEMAQTYHQQNYSLLHQNTGQSPSQINRSAFTTWRKQYWEWRSNDFQ